MLRKTEGKRKRRKKRMRMLDSISNLTDINLSKLREIVKATVCKKNIDPDVILRGKLELAVYGCEGVHSRCCLMKERM